MRINTVIPGVIMTPMSMPELEGSSAPTILKSIEMSALQRIGSPEDVAHAVAFLASLVVLYHRD